ncbi:hypothetical protein RFI_39022, partial [Reticulomyxa filosa]
MLCYCKFKTKKKEETKINTDQNKIEMITTSILKALLKNRDNRKYWIELLEKSDKMTSDSMFGKFLENSFKNWLGGSEEKSSYEDNNTFPSKVIELLSSSAFHNAKLYHSCWMEIAGERHTELHLDNKIWTRSDIEAIDTYAKQDMQLWEKLFRYMDNIPQKMELNTKEMETTNDKLCQNFEYCFRCSIWFQHKSPMKSQLLSLLGHMCTNLARDKKLFSVKLCKFLRNNLQRIHGLLVSPSTELKQSVASLDQMVQEYDQFSKLIDKFDQIRCKGYLIDQDLSTTLKTLAEERHTWEYQSFVQIKQQYAQDLQILAHMEYSMGIVLSLQSSFVFGEIWSKCNDKCKASSLLSEAKKPFSIFSQAFEESKRVWDNYGK